MSREKLNKHCIQSDCGVLEDVLGVCNLPSGDFHFSFNFSMALILCEFSVDFDVCADGMLTDETLVRTAAGSDWLVRE